MTPRIGAEFANGPLVPGDQTLGVFGFDIFPHLNAFPDNMLADAERSASDIDGLANAIDEQTAIVVTSGAVEVGSEGQWRRSTERSGLRRS